MTANDRWLLPEGMEELLPAEAAVAEQVRRTVLDLFRSWGYKLVIPPLVEFTDSLLIGLGSDIELQSFRLTDQLSGKPMAIRADITPQTARIDAHSMRARGINRLCYAGSVLHTRPKAILGSRCPIQAGAELYGDSSGEADVEIISLMLDMLHTVREQCAATQRGSATQSYTLDLGHVGIYRAVVAAMRAAEPSLGDNALDQINDAMQRKSSADLKALTSQYFSSASLQDALCQLPLLCGNKNVLSLARKLMPALCMPSTQAEQDFLQALAELEQAADVVAARFSNLDIYFDLTELRGFSYHTGLVFAAYTAGHGTALANGGRYDEVGSVFGAARPATGFNADIKALIRCLYTSLGSASDAQEVLNLDDAIAAPIDNDLALWGVIRELRNKGEVVVSVAGANLDKYRRKLVAQQGAWRVVANAAQAK